MARNATTQARRMATINQAAEYAVVDHKTIRRAIARGDVQAYRAGRIIRVDLDSVDGWLRPVRSARAVADGAA